MKREFEEGGEIKEEEGKIWKGRGRRGGKEGRKGERWKGKGGGSWKRRRKEVKEERERCNKKEIE